MRCGGTCGSEVVDDCRRAGVPHLAEACWAELVAELGVGLLLIHADGAVRATSEAAAQLLGCDPGGARPDGWRLRDDHGAPLPELHVLAAQARDADTPATIPVVVTARHPPPRRLWLELYPATLREERLVLVVLRPVYTDIWRGKGLLDPLTGLANRVLLFDRLDQALRRGRARGSVVTFVLADLRGLAALPVEDGDRLLRTVAERLTGGLREDHTVARYGGGVRRRGGAAAERRGCARGAGLPARRASGAGGVGDQPRRRHRVRPRVSGPKTARIAKGPGTQRLPGPSSWIPISRSGGW
ncbi:diguanylate cyclase [Actinophytocola sp.]|uniref:diguanylate cyclase domain-containing protein n=1 Tax=Actinophytocola sp. TaxID=1872138 RepID=UPI00345BF2B9